MRLAEQGRGIPAGYVLEKNLPKGIRDEVDAVQMDALFKHMGRREGGREGIMFYTVAMQRVTTKR